MDLALYDPDGGYYRADAARPGRDGDFLTAPEAHPIFGAALARAVADAWDRLDRPARFTLREYGAGTGALALAILDGSPCRAPGPRAPRSATSRSRSRRRGSTRSPPVSRPPGFASTLDRTAPDESIDGVILANEVLDALPTHRVVGARRRPARGPRRFRRTAEPSSTSRPTRPRPRWPRGSRPRASSSPTASGPRSASRSTAGCRASAAGLRRGVALFIDYGYPAAELYDPVRRRDGTLRAYLRHRVHDDPYVHVGRQDLTAHVDVTAVERAATAAGLTHLGTTTQAEFLVGLGTEDLLQAIQADPATTLEAYLAVRSALFRLLDPSAMGRFRVMAFGRDWPAGGPPLRGLGYRLAR